MLKAVLRCVAKKKKPAVKRVLVLVDAPPGKEFLLSSGQSLKNIKELKVALKGMQDEVYSYHTALRGNDFAKWTRDVLGQRTLAKKLEAAQTKQEAMRAIE